MLTLDLTNAPRWHDLAPGVRVQLRPLTTALMVATRSDPAVEAVREEASDEERAVAFAKALARRAVLAWEGIGDADGTPIDPSPEAIDALLDDLLGLIELFTRWRIARLRTRSQRNSGATLQVDAELRLRRFRTREEHERVDADDQDGEQRQRPRGPLPLSFRLAGTPSGVGH